MTILCFVAGTMFWINRFELASHRVDIAFDAIDAPALELHNSKDDSIVLATRYIQYPGSLCDWDVKIDTLGKRSPQGWGAEVWIQKIETENGPIEWDKVSMSEGWTRKPSGIATGGTALVSYGEDVHRQMSLSTHANTLSITYSRHQWTGIFRITANGDTRVIDSWKDSYAPESITFYAHPDSSQRAENRSEVFYVNAREIGPGLKLRVISHSGKIELKSASFDGKPIEFNEHGRLRLPSRFAMITLPALGMALACTPALSLLLILAYRTIGKHPFVCFSALTLMLKLWLVRGDEIRASPYDGMNYMESALAYFWGLGFEDHSYDRQPGYPLLISAARLLGIPLRIWLELLLFACAIPLARALPRFRLPEWTAYAAYMLIVFTPLSIPAFSFAYQDAAYGPYLLLLIGCMLHCLHDGRLRPYALAGTGIATAIVWNTRPEHALLAGLLGVFAVLLFLCKWAESHSIRTSIKQATIGILPAFTFTLALTLLFCGLARSGNMGAFATSNFQLKGFTALYDELLAIKPEHPRPYNTIPAEVRQKAYEASETFAPMREFMEGEVLDMYRPLAAAQDRPIKDDYGVFAFWGLRKSAWYLNHWHDARELDAFYARCAEELKQARLAGKYPSRKVQAHFIEPDTNMWLPFVNEGMRQYWQLLTQTRVEGLYDEPKGTNTSVFDKAALRRTAPAKDNQAMWSARVEEHTARARSIVAHISSFFTIGGAFAILGVPVLLILRARRNSLAETMPLIALFALLVAAFTSRFLLVSVMHAVAFCAESRYIFPVSPLPALICVAAIAMFWVELRRCFTNSETDKE